ncbi:hypothetical protein GCM10022393_27260 [Aquimarina addita]|uniref:T9SS C-terminal target domain-containing protein n=1 Tax=Aquimarina addita TaxID=870485 RepID=A0ABP6UPT5_9FLAO
MKKLILSVSLLASCAIFAQEPTVINDEFAEIPKNSGSDCACAGWINKDLGDQGETSSSGGLVAPNKAIKFDNSEADVAYQEIAVLPNTDYRLTYAYRLQDPTGNNPGMSGDDTTLEIRILSAAGYTTGYTPSYPAETDDPIPTFGYVDIAEVENAANNITNVTHTYPGNQDYNIATLDFNSGSDESIVLFMRGIGGTGAFDATYLWKSGEQETQVDYITLVNQTDANALGVSDFTANNNKFKMYQSEDFLNIQTDEALKSATVYDLNGRSMISSDSKSINVSALARGTYLLGVELLSSPGAISTQLFSK